MLVASAANAFSAWAVSDTSSCFFSLFKTHDIRREGNSLHLSGADPWLLVLFFYLLCWFWGSLVLSFPRLRGVQASYEYWEAICFVFCCWFGFSFVALRLLLQLQLHILLGNVVFKLLKMRIMLIEREPERERCCKPSASQVK